MSNKIKIAATTNLKTYKTVVKGEDLFIEL